MSTPLRSVLALLVLASFLVALAGCGGNVAAPTSFTKYQAKDGSFDVDYPAGWQAEGGGKGNYWAKFTQGSAIIRVATDLTGSLLGDIAGASTAGAEELPEELEPVAQVHQVGLEQMQTEMSNYTEQPPVSIQTGLGEGRRSEFTASNSFGGQLRGYRATFLGHERRISIVCQCKADNFETLRAGFEQVIQSATPGTAAP